MPTFPPNFCYGCYPNVTVSPITIQIEKKPKYPPYKRPTYKPITFEHLFPPGSQGQSAGRAATPCERCAKLLREKEIQLIRKDQELFQLQRHLRKHGGRKHDYGSVRQVEFQLRKKEHELAILNMEIAKHDTTKIPPPLERFNCPSCSKYLSHKEEQLKKIEQEVVKQMASPYIKVSPNPCTCCTDASILQINEKSRKKNKKNCFKELNKKEKKLLKKEREIDKKIHEFRKRNLKEAKEDMKKTPDSFIKEVYLNCKCACKRAIVNKRFVDPCAFNAAANAFTCTMPFPTWNGSLRMGPNMHACTTKCCVMKLLGSVANCYACPIIKKKKPPGRCCIPMRLVRWYVFRNKKLMKRRCF
ncbi:uncharacterized protein LOC134664793 [Cydia fagiglandana]|uniref:uncharacterized protein LOC134664793 n=1 Tax=Cydia fagiglandana TaxID=1458189 RepID=UPI002FEE3549